MQYAIIEIENDKFETKSLKNHGHILILEMVFLHFPLDIKFVYVIRMFVIIFENIYK